MALFVDIEKQIGDFCLQMQLETGDDILALLGASGSGKSMTLRCIAGIERPDRGRIVLDGVTLFDGARGIDLPPQQRRTGLLFQEYALFPHMTVRQNLLAGAHREPDRRKRAQLADEMLERFGLTALASRHPAALSGGERQRTALARMLVSDPGIVLLDEPFSALDSHLRLRLEHEVRTVLREFGRTVLLVSHDRDEVFRMADRIAVLANGAVEICGAKHAVFHHPQTRTAALLTGCRNLSAAERREDGIYASDWGIPLQIPAWPAGCTAVGIRAERICAGTGENSVRCRVLEAIEEPQSYTLLLQPVDTAGGTPLVWTLPHADWQRLRAGEIGICLPPAALLALRGGAEKGT